MWRRDEMADEPAASGALPVVVPDGTAGVVIEEPLTPQQHVGWWALIPIAAMVGVVVGIVWLVRKKEPTQFRILTMVIGLLIIAGLALLLVGFELALGEQRKMTFVPVGDTQHKQLLQGGGAWLEGVSAFATALKGLRASTAAFLLGSLLLGSAGFFAAWRADPKFFEQLSHLTPSTSTTTTTPGVTTTTSP
jgi:hypothetical protein